MIVVLANIKGDIFMADNTYKTDNTHKSTQTVLQQFIYTSNTHHIKLAMHNYNILYKFSEKVLLKAMKGNMVSANNKKRSCNL